MADSGSAQITVVILNWNGKDWLEKFLPFVEASAGDEQEVLVVDNGSTDDSVAFVRKTYSTMRILELEENLGFAEGNNRAIPHIHTPYFVLLNSDVEVTNGWLTPLLTQLNDQENLALVQPKVLAWHDRDSFEYAGAAGGWIDRWGYAFCRGRIFDVLEKDEGQYDSFQDCFWATGACLAGRTELIRQHGLFQGELFAHWEEIDLCWRMKNLGYRVAAEPASVVYHVGGGTLPQGNPRKTFLNVRNSLICLYLNLPSKIRFQRLLIRLLLDGVWAVKALFSADFGSIGAIIKGHWAFFGSRSFWSKRRIEIYGNQPPSHLPESGYWKGSIVWGHFANGKQTFSQVINS